MTKLGYAILFYCIVLVLFFIFILTLKRKTKLGNLFAVVIALAIFLNLTSAIYMSTNSLYVMFVMSSLWAVGTAWLIIMFIKFCFSYTDYKLNKYINISLYVLGFIDFVLFMVNIFTKFMMSYEPLIVNNDLYISMSRGWVYYVHLGVCYFLAIPIVGILLSKTINTSRLYKLRYISVLACVLLIAIFELLFHIIDVVYVNYSGIVYGIAMALVYYLILIYSPKTISSNIQNLIMSNMTDIIVIYDNLGNYFYSNNRANEYFDLDDIKKGYSYFKANFLDEVPEDGKSRIICINKSNKNYFFKTIIQKFCDEEKRIQAYNIIFHDITYEMQSMKEKKYNQTHDALTGAFNRDYFIAESESIIEMNRDENYYVVATNFVKFRLLNDLHGAQAGDKLLIQMASVLKKIANEHNFIYARIGADKFGICISQKLFDDLDFIQLVLNEYDKENKTMPLDLKFGVCSVGDSSVLLAYDRAVLALHYINSNYSEICSFYNDNVRDDLVRENMLLKEFENSINNNHFKIYFQPQINIADRDSIIGAEALVRWVHPEFGMISPSEFIPLFEKSGVISTLDKYVWEEACKFLNKWNNGKFKDLSVSVNVSPVDFYQMDIYDVVTNLVEKYEISPKKLKIEITETAFMSDSQKLIDVLKKLQDYGFIVEMDDFGSGYSSLNTLKDIPLNVIKLDMKFISNGQEEKSINILDSIVSMAHRLHLPVIAEGVETMEQRDMLNSMSCELIQGYLYARPMPIAEFEKYMKKSNISSFIDYWTQNSENKALFSMLKEIDRSYRNSPIPIIILNPVIDNNKCKDLIIEYGNEAFIAHVSHNAENVVGNSMGKVLNGLDDSWVDFYQGILDNRINKTIKYTLKDNMCVHIHAYPLEKSNLIVSVLTFLND